MAKPPRRETRGGRGSGGKGVARAGKPKAAGAKTATRKKPVVTPKKGGRAKAAPVPKRATPRVTPVVPTAVSTEKERKEGHMAETKQLTPDQFLATVLIPQFSRDTGHMCWDCKHFKPVLKGSKFPPTDTIGWCTMIHWPFYWCVTDFNVVKKCYTFDKGVYSTKKF